MPEERRSVIATYGPMLVAVLLTGGGAVFASAQQLAQVEQQLVDQKRLNERLTTMVLENTTELAEIRGRQLCEREQE